ncbi:MAG: hypothetical protein HY906_07910 [Deltaproteobacteria bacterium]|nr:hypothetical protein [Deltaproteobacteria bacterium]
MRILFLSPSGPQGAFQSAVLGVYHAVEEHALVLVDRLADVRAAHRVESRPSPAEIGWLLDHVWLSPDLYRECGRRLDAAIRGGRGDTRAVVARRLVDLAVDVSARLRHHLRRGPEAGARTASLMDAMELLQPLGFVIEAAHPTPSGPFVDPRSGFPVVSAAESMARADELWAVMEPLLPPGFLRSVAASEPDIVFFPVSQATLPRSIAMALKLRPRLRRSAFVAWHGHMSLSFSLAQVRRAAFASRALFDVFDAVSVYPDIEDQTFCDVVERLAGGGPLLGVENLALRHSGAVRFRRPSARSIRRYLDEIRLGRADPVPRSAVSPWHDGQTIIPRVTPVKQVCYWNRCHFCATASHSFIKQDPHVAQRGLATAEHLIQLRDEGVAVTFVGYDVVPPIVLEQLVARLGAEAAPPRWVFEGKVAPGFSAAFVRSLRAAGCAGAIFGLECASDRLHALVDKHAAGVDLRAIERLIGRFDGLGMAVHVNTIYDLPTTTTAEFEAYCGWLRTTFDHHRLFSFNVNPFVLMPGSRMARAPRRYGLRRLEVEGADRLCNKLPTARDPRQPRFDAGEVWRGVFGARRYRGRELAEWCALYCEVSASLFVDALGGRNLCKDLAAELGVLRDIGAARISLPTTVEAVSVGRPASAAPRPAGHRSLGHLLESLQQAPEPATLLVDTRGTGAWSQVPVSTWKVIEEAARGQLTVDQAVAGLAGHGPSADRRRQALRAVIADLVADRLLHAAW